MIKYSLGIDISKSDFHACINTIDQAQVVRVKSSCKCSNSPGGFAKLTSWLDKHHKEKGIPLVICMEATGIYYEHLALYLYRKNYQVSVILPNRAKKYLQSEGLKSKNDKIDAQGLARMGAEKCLKLWQPMDGYFYRLRQLTRQHQSLQELKTAVGSQLHAAAYSMYPDDLVIGQLKALISTLDDQIKGVEVALSSHIAAKEEVSQKVNNICRIKGVGLLSIAVILAETNGFALFENSRQLVSYSGYDVVENQSGKHSGKTRISKKGNSRIRRILHMPAFNAVRFSKGKGPFDQLYVRTMNRHGKKMKSYVAVQKKLLVLIYSLWKSGKPYNPDYGARRTGEGEQEPSSLHSGPAAMKAKKPVDIKENSATQRAALHKVDLLSKVSQYASSLQE
jgi:transposase